MEPNGESACFAWPRRRAAGRSGSPCHVADGFSPLSHAFAGSTAASKPPVSNSCLREEGRHTAKEERGCSAPLLEEEEGMHLPCVPPISVHGRSRVATAGGGGEACR